MSQEEWIRRYRNRFMDKTDMGYAEANRCVEAVTFAEASDGYEDDPEGAADEEMSYWTD